MLAGRTRIAKTPRIRDDQRREGPLAAPQSSRCALRRPEARWTSRDAGNYPECKLAAGSNRWRFVSPPPRRRLRVEQLPRLAIHRLRIAPVPHADEPTLHGMGASLGTRGRSLCHRSWRLLSTRQAQAREEIRRLPVQAPSPFTRRPDPPVRSTAGNTLLTPCTHEAHARPAPPHEPVGRVRTLVTRRRLAVGTVAARHVDGLRLRGVGVDGGCS